jgi:hypothetical protein
MLLVIIIFFSSGNIKNPVKFLLVTNEHQVYEYLETSDMPLYSINE